MKKLFSKQNKKQSKKIQSLHSTEMNREEYVLQMAQIIPSSCLLRRTCKDVSISQFIQAYYNGDLSGLIIPGSEEPTKGELITVWNEILLEYSSLIKDENSDYIFGLEKQISDLQYQIFYIDNAIDILRIRWEPDLANELMTMGYEVINDDNLETCLNRIHSLAKTKVFDLKMLHDEYEKINKTVSGKKQSEEEYISTVIWLSKFQNYAIDIFTTSIYMYTIIFNNYLAAQKAKSKAVQQ